MHFWSPNKVAYGEEKKRKEKRERRRKGRRRSSQGMDAWILVWNYTVLYGFLV